jgi:hypothetical protein
LALNAFREGRDYRLEGFVFFGHWVELRRHVPTEVLGSLTSEASGVKQTSARVLTYRVPDKEARRR